MHTNLALRIVIFWDYYGPYHNARMRELKAQAAQTDCAVVALELASGSDTYAWKRGAESCVDHTLFPAGVSERIHASSVFKAVRSYLKLQKPDVLFVPSYWPGYSLAATLAAKSLGIRVVVMADSHYDSGTNKGVFLLIKRLLINLYSGALVAGSAQKSFFRYLGMPGEKILDGYDVVDNGYFLKRSAGCKAEGARLRRDMRLPSRYILSLGRFVKKKNLLTIIRAYAAAARSGQVKGVHLLFVGAGSQREEMEKLAALSGLPVLNRAESEAHLAEHNQFDHAVVFHPFAQIETIPIYYSLADCFVLASKSEEWGLVVNEAMACGCPVIVSRAVGCSHDLVDSGETGYRFDPENPEELAWFMQNLLLNSDLRAKFEAQGLKRIQEWGVDRFAKNVLAVAAIALGGPGAPDGQPSSRNGDLAIALIQTSFPDYRIPVYDGLSALVGDKFHLYTGMEYFTPDVRTCSVFRPWVSMVRNSFLFRRRFLWQGTSIAEALCADIAILELNPRILSNWVILMNRFLWNRPTIVWGHAWGRSGQETVRNVLRLLMARMATAIITYTHSQRLQLQRVLSSKKIYAAPNSLIKRAECFPEDCKIEDLDTILYVGRLNAKKKPALLLSAFSGILNRLPSHVSLCFVGSGAEELPLKSRVNELGLGDRVRFTGHVSEVKMLRSLYARSFCSVSPGYVGLSAIQSFSLGVPMVVADREDHAPEIEACIEGVNTVFFNANSPEALGERLVQMWADRALWHSRRGDMSRWAGERYSADSMVEAFWTAINEAKN